MMNLINLPFNPIEPGPATLTAGRKASGFPEGHPCSSPHHDDLFIPGEPAVQFLHAGQAPLSPVISMDAASELLTGAPIQARIFNTGGLVSSSPCIGPDGTVYVGSQDGALYEIYSSKDRLLQQSESEPDKAETDTILETDDEWLTIDGVRLRIHQGSDTFSG